MNNLTTRKIVLGLLMALVLAFSVQGIADATLTPKASTEDPDIIFTDGSAASSVNTFTFTVTAKDAMAVDQVVISPEGAIITNITATGFTRVDATISPTSDTSVSDGDRTVTVFYTVVTRKKYTFAVGGTTVYTAYALKADRFAERFTTGTPTPQLGGQGFDRPFAVTMSPWVQVDLSVSGGSFIIPSTVPVITKSGGTRPTSFSTFTEVGDSIILATIRVNNNQTAKVTARIPGSNVVNATRVVTYFFNSNVTLKRMSGNNQFGSTNTTPTAHTARRLTHPLVVRLLDGDTRGVSGQDVKFGIDDVSNSGGAVLRAFSSALLGNSNGDGDGSITDLGDNNRSPIIVKTDGSGNAKVYLVPGTNPKEYMVTVSNPVTEATTLLDPAGFKFTATATADVRGGANLKIDKDDAKTTQSPQRDAKFGTVNKSLAMSVEIVMDDTSEAPSGNVQVNFQINGGRIYLEPATLDLTQPDYQTLLTTVTNSSGIATVNVEVNNGATATVKAQIVGNNSPNGRYTVTYFWGDPNYDDDSSSGSGNNNNNVTNTITISPLNTTGEPGEEVTINVTSSPSGVFATLGSNDFEATRFSPQSGFTPLTSTLLLPVEEGTHSFFATSGALTAGRASVTVESELGTLSITAIGAPAAGLQTFSITALDSDGDTASAPFTVRLSGTGFTTRTVEIAGGSGNARLTLPTAASLYTLTASAEGYTSGTTQVRIAGTGQQQVADEDEEEVEEEVTVAAEPDSIEITGPSTRSGTVNEELDTPLLVRVLDDDGDGLEGARVFYRVTGRGRISDGSRGGRSIGVITDDDGYARANFTPTAGGSSTVRVNTDDVSRIVTFTITTGSAPTPRGPGTGVPSGTSVSPVVHVAAASRPPMLWVDGGAIYALVGASPQRFAASVDNALNITVGGGKVYWTEKTGEMLARSTVRTSTVQTLPSLLQSRLSRWGSPLM